MNPTLGNRAAVLALVGPALLVYTLVVLVPIVWSFGYTFFSGGIITGFTWAGLDNWQKLLGDQGFWDSAFFTIRYAVAVTTGQIVFGMLFALVYVFYLQRGGWIVRTLVFFPVVLPTVAVAQLFSKLVAIAPQYGLLNSILDGLHMGNYASAWLSDPGGAFWVIVIMDIWRAMGFYAILMYAGLLDIPAEIIEAARVDGASTVRLVRHVILPLMMPIVLSSFIFSLNGTLKVFDSIYALTSGGPGQATTPLTLLFYRTAFNYGEYGYGSTIAMSLAIMCLVMTVIVFRSARRDVA